MKPLFYKNGQSLFEVVLALAIIVLIIVGLVFLTNLSLKNSRFSKMQSLAANYLQEAFEWLRKEKENDWFFFETKAQTLKYCLPSLSWESAKVGSCQDSDFISDSRFKREVEFFIEDPSTIEVKIEVYWEDENGFHKVSSATNFVKNQ